MKNVMKKIAVGALIGGVFSTYFYAFGVEPFRVKKRDVLLRTRFGGSKGTLKVVQFTDVHLGTYFSLTRLLDLVEKINKEKPDIICFTGDLVNNPLEYKANKEASMILKKLFAKHGKYAILGNHDFRGDIGKQSISILRNAGFVVLNNSEATFKLNSEMNISIVGLADSIYQRQDYSIIHGKDENTLSIVLTHETEFSEEIAKKAPDIILAGHSHGGQIRLPFIGPVVTTHHANDFVRGMYKIKNSLLYVDSGIGVSAVPARFLACPEYSVINIV